MISKPASSAAHVHRFFRRRFGVPDDADLTIERAIGQFAFDEGLILSGLPPPEPAPISGIAMDRYPRFAASAIAFRTESRIDRSDDRQKMLIPATWMIDLNGSLPADVSTA